MPRPSHQAIFFHRGLDYFSESPTRSWKCNTSVLALYYHAVGETVILARQRWSWWRYILWESTHSSPFETLEGFFIVAYYHFSRKRLMKKSWAILQEFVPTNERSEGFCKLHFWPRSAWFIEGLEFHPVAVGLSDWAIVKYKKMLPYLHLFGFISHGLTTVFVPCREYWLVTWRTVRYFDFLLAPHFVTELRRAHVSEKQEFELISVRTTILAQFDCFFLCRKLHR